jgi:hypothetical protein
MIFLRAPSALVGYKPGCLPSLYLSFESPHSQLALQLPTRAILSAPNHTVRINLSKLWTPIAQQTFDHYNRQHRRHACRILPTLPRPSTNTPSTSCSVKVNSLLSPTTSANTLFDGSTFFGQRPATWLTALASSTPMSTWSAQHFNATAHSIDATGSSQLVMTRRPRVAAMLCI